MSGDKSDSGSGSEVDEETCDGINNDALIEELQKAVIMILACSFITTNLVKNDCPEQ